MKLRAIVILAVCSGLLVPGLATAHDGSPHSESDEYWAKLAQDAPAFVVENVTATATGQLHTHGEWGPVLPWPHIPVSAASLPDGRILTFASNQPTTFPEGPEFTYAAVWDPATGAITTRNHGQHDMFCGHLVMLEDGRVFINGGRNTVPLTSAFDYQTDQWNLLDDMNRGRWYPTTVALPDGGVFTAIGMGGSDTAEVWRPGSGWLDLTSLSLTSIMNGVGFEKDWWPYLHVDPTGRLFHSGPVADMHRVDPYGSGSIQNLGPWMPGNGWYSKHAAVVMYDEGKILVAGGDDDGSDTDGSTDRVLAIDLNGPSPLPTEVAPMAFARRFANAVMLPDGRVLVVGGNTSGKKFNDEGTVLGPELWDPATDTWQELSDLSVPRNYHSVALLLTDGRVFSAGGGLCGCAADHPDAQVYSPPYLYESDGSPAVRPTLGGVPPKVRNGESFAVQGSANIVRFTAIKMSATTHAVNTDLRFLTIPHSIQGPGDYLLTAHPSRDAMTPGYWMLFGLDDLGVPSVAAVIQVSSEDVPQATHPGAQTSAEGDGVSLLIAATDPNGDPLDFSATGLPTGLSIDPNTGWITGTIAAGAAGSYESAIDVHDAAGGPTLHFTWAVVPGGLGSGQILREWWTGLSGAGIADLFSAPDYPDAPTGSDMFTLLEGPTDWADDYGTRVRGYVHPPLSGDYRFWIATDDNGELHLSSDDSPVNTSLIAQVPSWSSSQQWDKFPEQESALIALQAGQRYYIEVLQKESGGGDNLAVAWEFSGSPRAVIDGAYLSPFTGTPPGGSIDVDPLNSGVACQDDATGSGYLMYSAQSVHDRWSANPPISSGAQVNADHFICVVQIGGGWQYDTNEEYYPFTPIASDILMASLDFDADSISPMMGQQGAVGGIAMGYAAGDLSYLPNLWNGSDNEGEFEVSGTSFTPNGAGGCGDLIVDAGEDCDGTPCCTGSCTFSAAGTSCDDGSACTAADTCDGAGSCNAGAPVVCDDGLFCNGAEGCDPAGGCVSGVPPLLDDGVACTDDSCDEVGNTVLHLTQDALCDDGAFCNGAELCDAVLDCQAGTPPLLDDGVPCTVDACDEVADTVTHVPNAALCDDLLFCNGAEICDAGSDCLSGPAPPIDDGVACTNDSCDEVLDTVVHTPDAGLCDDADVCTEDLCDLLAGCQHDPLAEGPQGEVCEGGPPQVPLLPLWGTPLLGVLLGGGGLAALRARRRGAPPTP